MTLTAGLLGNGVSIDERLAVCVLAVAVAALVHAFSYTAAEGAYPSKRWLFQRGADMLALVALYTIIRVWI